MNYVAEIVMCISLTSITNILKNRDI